jgi:hypothetical protein
LRELQLRLKTGARDELLQELSHDIVGLTNHATNGVGVPTVHDKKF